MTLSEQMAQMAAERLTLRQAADRMGLSYDKFRDLRRAFPGIRWTRKLSAEQVKAIHSDARRNSLLAEQYDVHPSIISKIKSGAAYGAITGAAQGRELCQ